MSWCCCASSTRPFTRPRSSATVGSPRSSTRSASVFTKNPISPSISLRPRFAVGVPITTSLCPDSRLSTTAHPASSTVNSVVPCRRPSPFSPAVSSAPSSSPTNPPA